MTDEPENGAIRRILIAIDTSPHSLAALQAAAELARRQNAELLGLFVEDINLLRLAELPFAREVSHYTATVTQFSRDQIETQMRAQARHAQRAVRVISQRSQVRYDFWVRRGAISREVLSAAAEADLLVMGKSGWSRRRRQMGSTTRVVIAQAPRYTLILQQGTRFQSPLGVVYDGSLPARQALALAATLLDHNEIELHVIILSGDIEQARQLQAEASRWLRENGLEARYRWLIYPSLNRMVSLAQEENLGALIMPADVEVLQEEELANLLNELDIPVMLVR